MVHTGDIYTCYFIRAAPRYNLHGNNHHRLEHGDIYIRSRALIDYREGGSRLGYYFPRRIRRHGVLSEVLGGYCQIGHFQASLGIDTRVSNLLPDQ